MPKMKTHKGAAKRFKKTGKGKYKFTHAGAQHMQAKKTSKRKRRLRKGGILTASDAKRVKRLLP